MCSKASKSCNCNAYSVLYSLVAVSMPLTLSWSRFWLRVWTGPWLTMTRYHDNCVWLQWSDDLIWGSELPLTLGCRELDLELEQLLSQSVDQTMADLDSSSGLPELTPLCTDNCYRYPKFKDVLSFYFTKL